MERIVTTVDQHGRLLIPSVIRERFNIECGEKLAIEIIDNEIKIVNADYVIDEMHKLFMKNKNSKKISIVDDFNDKKHQEFLIEETRNKKDA